MHLGRWGLPLLLAIGTGLIGLALTSRTLSKAEEPAPATPHGNVLPGIVFVGAPVFDPGTDGGDGVYQGSYHWRDGYLYPRSATYHRGERTMGPPRPGRNLYSLIPAQPDGKLTRLTHLTTGAVYRPEPSYDGARVLFAMRRDGEDWFHLYEMSVDGTALRQLTDGPFNDFAGVYLPDGRIVFCSDRTGYLEEYHEERTETLFVMNADGHGIRQITFLPGTYFEPSVLPDGRILFSFWDAFHIDVPPFDKHETYLMTVNPDGTEERHFFGSGQYRFFNRERHSGVSVTQARALPDGRILCQTELGPSLLDPRAGLSVRDALAPIFPGTSSVQLGGTTHRVHLSPLGTRSTPYPLPDGRVLFSATLPGARDSGIWIADPDTRDERLVLNLPDHAEFDAVPVLMVRPKPAVLPSQGDAKSSVTRYLVVVGDESDLPERSLALQQARFFRVIEGEYTGVTTSSHTNLETRILGVVPIQPDGSAYFEAPADTPIFLDPIDAAGNRVLMVWPYANTAVKEHTWYPATQMAYMSGRPGETKSCYGCHAPQTVAVPNEPLQALRHPPVQIRRESTDIQYRRNEPDGYRRQARIGEAMRYRPWLTSQDATLRARACEMLMYIEDGTQPDMPALARLLTDSAVEVRRAAALALTRLATPRERAALEVALSDADWQVRFAARAAVDAILEVRHTPGNMERVSPTHLVFERLGRQDPSPATRRQIHEELAWSRPNVLALRAAGKMKDADAVPLLIPWLKYHEMEYHAAEAAVALGRIGTPEAVKALWQGLREEVPNRKVHISRYLQHGPRPEEYALLRGLLLAEATVRLDDVHLLIALLPNTFMEKPRFEDRMRPESQRVLMPRLLLDKAGLRDRCIEILLSALRGSQKPGDPLYEQVVKGINLERPFSEHGRPFLPINALGAEEALWLLGCLLDPARDLDRMVQRAELEALVVPFLTAKNHRERIDAAVLLGLTGFGSHAAEVLLAEIMKPYPFPEIASIGKGMPDDNFRDKAYFALALARHVQDMHWLKPLCDPLRMTRDVRYGLTHGLAARGKADAIPLLIDLATRDPITLIRQQARYALADIQDAHRLAGRPVPDVTLPEPQPLEMWYPPRGLTWPAARVAEADRPASTSSQRATSLEQTLVASSFRNLNNAQVTGAQRMMVAHVEDCRRDLCNLFRQTGRAGETALRDALDSPYPFAHYVAADAVPADGRAETTQVILNKLEKYVKSAETVGLWWSCESLARLKAREALPVLKRLAVPTNPPGTFGPEGMAAGYPAARALARIVADRNQSDVARLLASDNNWLKAGALRGLAEAGAPEVETLLRQAARPENAALVRQEATVQLRWLNRN